MSTALGGKLGNKDREVPGHRGNPVDSLKNFPVIRFFFLKYSQILSGKPIHTQWVSLAETFQTLLSNPILKSLVTHPLNHGDRS